MSDSGSTEATEPDATPGSLAGSTLRALRAGRGGPAQPVDEPTADEPTLDEPTLDEPTADEPTLDEPTLDEPTLDEPTLDEPAAAIPAATPSRSRIPLAVAAAATTAALVFAVISIVVWHNAGNSTTRSAAAARDAAALQARLDIEAVNTSDYRHASDVLKSWLSASTGALHSSYQSSQAATIKTLEQAKAVTTATVLDAAVTQLSDTKGTATVIASVNVVHRPSTGAAFTARNRFSASMQRVNGQWKLANLSLVAVQAT